MGAENPPGNVEPEKGSLYLIKQGKQVTKHLSKIGISNGMAWNQDKTKLYYIDTLRGRVDSYDYTDATGAIGKFLYLTSVHLFPFIILHYTK